MRFLDDTNGEIDIFSKLVYAFLSLRVHGGFIRYCVCHREANWPTVLNVPSNISLPVLSQVGWVIH
jgi:hypothetical protein